jgi:hypothetical protein
MRTDARPIEITVADLQADAEGVIRSLPASSEAAIVSSSGEVIAMLATAAPSPPLTAEQVAEIRQAFADAEKEDPSTWIDHDDFMRELDEDERNWKCK